MLKNLCKVLYPPCSFNELFRGGLIILKINYLPLVIFAGFALMLFPSCDTLEGDIPSSEAEIDLEEATFLQDDFTLMISTLPYRGAVLFIDYVGEANISDYSISVDISQGGKVKNMPIEVFDNQLVAKIVDLMLKIDGLVTIGPYLGISTVTITNPSIGMSQLRSDIGMKTLCHLALKIIC